MKLTLLLSIAIWIGSPAIATEPTAEPMIEVSLSAPADVAQGETFEVPVTIRTYDKDVASYAFRLRFHPRAFRIVEINGGTFEGFSDVPVTNPAVFDKGRVTFTAINRGFMQTSESIIVATIKVQAIGPPGRRGKLYLRRVAGGEVITMPRFERARATFRYARAKVAIQ